MSLTDSFLVCALSLPQTNVQLRVSTPKKQSRCCSSFPVMHSSSATPGAATGARTDRGSHAALLCNVYHEQHLWLTSLTHYLRLWRWPASMPVDFTGCPRPGRNAHGPRLLPPLLVVTTRPRTHRSYRSQHCDRRQHWFKFQLNSTRVY